MDSQKFIRNFAIVAHIDHGKSTLADRLLEVTGTIDMRHMQEQVLDSNPIERERGITIKLAPVRMIYKEYILNLIDTPGHVDFSYEVSRSLAACEGILLVVDATQGIQAQTLSHMQLIKKHNLKVIPIINKIDLALVKIKEVKKQIADTFGFHEEEILEISAKNGINIDKVLEAIIVRIPSPVSDLTKPFRALIFSSQYDTHKGVIVYIRVFEGEVNKEDLYIYMSKVNFFPVEIGIFNPEMKVTTSLKAGEVGYIATGLKDLTLAKVGDTLMSTQNLTNQLPGFAEPKPMVYLCLFPQDFDEYLSLREGIDKLHLSDGSFSFKPFSSVALGKGFMCGFLGLLHAEVVRERLEKEFKLSIITTPPSVEYHLSLSSGITQKVHSAGEFPDPTFIKSVMEPIMMVSVFAPSEYTGAIMQLCQDKRGEYVHMEYIGTQVKFTYLLPLSEMIVDFFDNLKAISSGYASLDFEFYEMRQVEVVKMDILFNKDKIDAFSQIVLKDRVVVKGRLMVEKLKEIIPRQQFQVPIQAVFGGKIIAREDVKSFRKDVTGKLYGGDQSRKDKLLDAQKKGKKKMKIFGNVQIPSDVFIKLYKR